MQLVTTPVMLTPFAASFDTYIALARHFRQHFSQCLAALARHFRSSNARVTLGPNK
jgi:hypothetical protein